MLFNSPVILQPPNLNTIYLEQTAVFKCEVNGGVADWKVNGHLYNDLILFSDSYDDLDTDRENTDGGNVLLTLTIPGRAEYNGTSVQCIIFGSVPDESEIVTMKIQGIAASLLYTVMYTYIIYNYIYT